MQHKTSQGSVAPASVAYHTRSVLGGVGISKQTTTVTKSSGDLDWSASMNETKSASLQENKEAVFSTNQLHETTQTSAVDAVSNSVGAPMATTTNEANVKSSTPPPAKDTATVLLDKVSGKRHTHTIIIYRTQVPTFYDIERYPTKERFLNCSLIHGLNTVVRLCTREITSYTSHVIHFPNASLTLSLFLCFHCLYNGTILYIRMPHLYTG